MRRPTVLTSLAVTGAILLAGCNMMNPDRPEPQPDTTVYGNLLEVTKDAKHPDMSVVHLKVGIPRALVKADEEHRRPTPAIGSKITAEVTVGPDSVVLRRGGPAVLKDFDPGTEMVALPVAGTTRMVGADRLLCEAAYLMDFETYRRWRLPKLGGGEQADNGDPARINSPGVEHSPVPVGAGRVLYFAAHLRPAWKPGAPFIGARRPGLPDPSGESAAAERSYRTELEAGGWTAPRPVVFPGMAAKAVVRVTWVNEAETACLLTIVDKAGGKPWVGRSERPSAARPWGPVERLKQLGKDPAEDAVYLAGSSTMLGFARPGATTNEDLFLFTPKKGKPMPLDPRINTPGREWCPRVGPTNQLFFCRGDRQLEYTHGAVRAVRLPGRFRKVITEANPTRDGAWIFFCRPRYTPVELDQDIFVARWNEDGSLGEAIPVDDWRPAPERAAAKR